MTNIVERLRRMADMTTTDNALSVIGEAADEIERLREALKRIARYDHSWPQNAADIARAALRDKP